MKSFKFAFRFEVSKEIGSGHAVRCVTLARALNRLGHKTVLICNAQMPGEISSTQEVLVTNSAEREVLGHRAWPSEIVLKDSSETLRLCSSLGVTHLIVDSYALDERWESPIKESGVILIAIDDLANRRHASDFLIDTNLVNGYELRYSSLLKRECERLLGPKYAILRPEFAMARGSSKTRTQVKKILLFFGGYPPSGLFEKVIRSLESVFKREKPELFLLNSREGLQKFHKLYSGPLTNLPYSNEIADLINQMDLAICSGGTFTWERACLGLPGIVISTARNQIEGSDYLDQMGGQTYLGTQDGLSTEKLNFALKTYCENKNKLSNESDFLMSEVDGQGVDRILERLLVS